MRSRIMRYHYVVAFVLFFAPSIAQADNVCRMYEHIHYGGEVLKLEADQQIANLRKRWGDRISSLQISHRCELRVCEHDNFRGRCRTYTGDVPNLQDWGDIISSARCECREEKYHRRHERGEREERDGRRWQGEREERDGRRW